MQDDFCPEGACYSDGTNGPIGVCPHCSAEVGYDDWIDPADENIGAPDGIVICPECGQFEDVVDIYGG